MAADVKCIGSLGVEMVAFLKPAQIARFPGSSWRFLGKEPGEFLRSSFHNRGVTSEKAWVLLFGEFGLKRLVILPVWSVWVSLFGLFMTMLSLLAVLFPADGSTRLIQKALIM